MAKAPWSYEQLKALDNRQMAPKLHAYTCNCGDVLRPTRDGWFCWSCKKIVQDWCHDFDFEPWWEAIP
jgi:hypothetical protein